MTSADLTLFLPQVGVILGVTVVLGRIGRALKLPALVGTTTHAAEMIGTHAVFGAFLAGVAVSRATGARVHVLDAIRRITIEVCVPLYFVSIGLRANLATHFGIVLVPFVLAVATIGKVGGVALGATLGGKPRREAFASAFAPECAWGDGSDSLVNRLGVQAH